jgi:hypothetical protein
LKGFPHLTRVFRSLCSRANIVIENGGKRSNRNISVIQSVGQGCPLLPTLFNLYLENAVTEWQESADFLKRKLLTTLVFADDHMTLTASDDSLQKFLYQLSDALNV